MKDNIETTRNLMIVIIAINYMPHDVLAYNIGINPEEDIFIRCLNGDCRSTTIPTDDNLSFVEDPFDRYIYGTDLGVMACGEQKCYMIYREGSPTPLRCGMAPSARA